MWLTLLLVCLCVLILNLRFLQHGCCGLLSEPAIDLAFVKTDFQEVLSSTTYQSMEGTSVYWCLATHVSFPGDKWVLPWALLESSGVNQDSTSFCLLRSKAWPLKQLRVWCNTAGQEVLADVFVTSTFKDVFTGVRWVF